MTDDTREVHHEQCPWAKADPQRLRSVCGCPEGWPKLSGASGAGGAATPFVLERDREWLLGAADSLVAVVSEHSGRAFDHVTRNEQDECATCAAVADELAQLLVGTGPAGAGEAERLAAQCEADADFLWGLSSNLFAVQSLRAAAIILRRLAVLESKGIDWRVLAEAYDWTFNYKTGEIAGLTAGDHGFEDTGIVVPEIAKLQTECDQAQAALAEKDAALGRVQALIETWEQRLPSILGEVRCRDEVRAALRGEVQP